ncbi:MAG TPA: hypothetical protein VFC78_19260 [Tepidisphaeraceae bacterium]|nr:hypothetical protein [Tepidisphaeraceae bacterium]
MSDLQPQTPVNAAPAQARSSDTDALAHLHKMSGTGSAFGTTDYVAINPTAIAALALGLASALALALGLLLILPVAGIVCAIFALIQIHGSNGTQTGRAFAVGGLLLSLLLGGSVIAREAWKWKDTRTDTLACAAVITRLGQDLHAERYDEIYEDLFTSGFRHREDITRQSVRMGLASLHFSPPYGQTPADRRFGQVDSMNWNGKMDFETVGGAETGVRLAYAMALVHFHGVSPPSRQILRLSNREGAWKIDNWERLFPEPKKKKNGAI